MVSLTEIRSRLQSAFTPSQADLIASLHVEMHDQLVTRNDFAELRGAVERLADSQQGLAAAQQRTEQRVEELTVAQQRTEQRVEELTVAQQRTEQRVEELTVAQQRTEQRVEELTHSMRRVEHVVTELTTTVNTLGHSMKDLAKQVGGLAATAGGNLEAYACERIPEVLGERFGFVLDSCGSESFVVDGKEFEFDAVLRGTIAGRPVVVLCEVKTNISESEVRGFLRAVDRVRSAILQASPGGQVQPLFFGYRAAVVTQRLITGNAAWLIFPRGLVAAA
jgi:prefoldin subunit 5